MPTSLKWFPILRFLPWFNEFLTNPTHSTLTHIFPTVLNALNAELNPICQFLALVGAQHILHVIRVSVNYPYNIRSFGLSLF